MVLFLDDCYFDHTGDPILHRSGPQLWDNEQDKSAEITSSKTAPTRHTLEAMETMTSTYNPNAQNVDLSAPSSTEPVPANPLEAGIMRRMASMLYTRIDKEQKVLSSQMESLINRRTAGLWQDRKLARKATMMEIFQSWDDPVQHPEGLPVKIRNAVEARVDKIADMASVKTIGKYRERLDVLEKKVGRLELRYGTIADTQKQAAARDRSKVAELEERLATLEKAEIEHTAASTSAIQNEPSKEVYPTAENTVKASAASSTIAWSMFT